MYNNQMKYCLACKDEYLPEITNCGVCGSKLLSGGEILARKKEKELALQRRGGPLTPQDDIITIYKGPLAEVKRIEAKLAEEKIGTRIIGEKDGCGKGCCGSNVELQIRRDDGQDAQRIIELDFEKMTGISDFSHDIVDSVFDPGAPTSTCPACGFTFSTSGSTCPDCGLCFG